MTDLSVSCCWLGLYHRLDKMPNNRRLTKKTIKGKDGLHPGSRKGIYGLYEGAGLLLIAS